MFDIEKIVRKNILDLKPYSSARDEFSGEEGIFLDANENPYGTLNRYPDPYQKKLKKKLSELKAIPIENIFIGNGSDEVIDLTYRVFCNPSVDKAIVFTPTYGMYSVSAGINDIELIEIPLNDSFQIDTDLLEEHLNGTFIKLIFICSPNNPTGNNMENIDWILNKFKGIIVLDEAYIDFSESESYLRRLSLYPNLIISQTFSKAWGLAGVRVGVAYASSEIISLLNKVKAPYNVSELNQEATFRALENYKEFVSNITIIMEEKKMMIAELQSIRLVRKIYPSHTNFLLVEVNNANEVYNELVSRKIITRNRNAILKNCIRITVGRPTENKALITALKEL